MTGRGQESRDKGNTNWSLHTPNSSVNSFTHLLTEGFFIMKEQMGEEIGASISSANMETNEHLHLLSALFHHQLLMPKSRKIVQTRHSSRQKGNRQGNSTTRQIDCGKSGGLFLLVTFLQLTYKPKFHGKEPSAESQSSDEIPSSWARIPGMPQYPLLLGAPPTLIRSEINSVFSLALNLIPGLQGPMLLF